MTAPSDRSDLAQVMRESDHVVVVAGFAYDEHHRKHNVVLADVRGDDLAALADVLDVADGDGSRS